MSTSKHWSGCFWFGFVAFVTAIDGPHDWQFWAAAVLLFPITSCLGELIAVAIGAERWGPALRDRVARYFEGRTR